MIRNVEAIVQGDGRVVLKEPIHLTHPHRAIVTIIDDPEIPETALLSEDALRKDWDRPEEDAAWSHLQEAQ